MCSIQKIRNVRSHEFSEFKEDPEYLPLLGELQFLYLIIELDNLCRLDESCLSGSRLVVDKSSDALLVGSAYRDEHLAVANRNACVGIHDALLLRLLEDCTHPSGYCSFFFAKRFADVVKFI